MNIISIDVGIKNLAYCLFFINKDKTYEIMQWETINLANDKKVCCGKKKNNTKCEKNAKFFKNENFYCKIHAKKKQYKIPSNNLKKTSIKKSRVAELKTLCKNFNIIFEKKCKKQDIINKLETYIDKNYFSFVNTINSNNLSIVSLGIKMKEKLDDLLSNINIHSVIIENQISPIANRMKTLQGMIIQHFIENGVTDIKEISASNKLKEFLGEHQKTTYNERKKLGIKHCTQIICSNPSFSQWDNFFISHKKKR